MLENNNYVSVDLSLYNCGSGTAGMVTTLYKVGSLCVYSLPVAACSCWIARVWIYPMAFTNIGLGLREFRG